MKSKTSATSRLGPIIAPFYANSLTTIAYKWLLPEAWDEGMKIYYLENRQKSPCNYTNSIPWTTPHHHPQQRAQGPWLLVPEGEGPTSWLECTVIHQAFTKAVILVGQNKQGWNEATKPMLSMMISGCILMGGVDFVRLLAENGAVAAELAELGLGSTTPIWTPNRGLDHPNTKESGIHTTAIDIDIYEWWASTHGSQNKKELAYLEKRASLSQMRSKSHTPSQRRRRSLLQTLFGRKK